MKDEKKTFQGILTLMNRLRPEEDIKTLRRNVSGLRDFFNENSTTPIGIVQAADIYFFVGDYCIELLGTLNNTDTSEDLQTESIPPDQYLETVKVLFKEIVSDFHEVWHDANSSILRFLQGASPEIQELDYTKIDKLVAIISNFGGIPYPVGRIRTEIIIEAVYNYIIFALSGWRRGRVESSRNHVKTAVRWLINDLDMHDFPRNQFIHGFAVLRNVLPPKEIVQMDQNTRIRETSRFEWSELIHPSSELEITDQMELDEKRALTDEAKYQSSFHTDSLCILEVALPNSDISELDKIKTQESFHTAIDNGKKLRAIFYDVVSCMRLLYGIEVGMIYLSHTGIHIETPPQTPNFKPEYRPPHTISGLGDDYVPGMNTRNNQEFEINDIDMTKLSEFWKLFRAFRIETTKTDFHKYYDRAIIRFNQAIAETYIEDSIIDLAMSLEILVKGPAHIISYRISMLVLPEQAVATQEIISDLFKLRNDCVHGTGFKTKKQIRNGIEVYESAREIACACFRNVIYYSQNAAAPTGEQGFSKILDAAIVNDKMRHRIHDVIPTWSLILSFSDARSTSFDDTDAKNYS